MSYGLKLNRKGGAKEELKDSKMGEQTEHSYPSRLSSMEGLELLCKAKGELGLKKESRYLQRFHSAHKQN
eukprot:scaffold179714_cov13-Tisochrysis_lutea.AAC.1